MAQRPSRRWLTALRVVVVACVAGVVVGHEFGRSRYYDIQDVGYMLVRILSLLGIIVALVAYPKIRNKPLQNFASFALLAFFIAMPLLDLIGAFDDRPPYWAEAKSNLHEIATAMWHYSAEHSGYLPYHEDGPLPSLALLYPKYLENAEAFASPMVTYSWWRRHQGPYFPRGTNLAGTQCHFGYTWRVAPSNPTCEFAIMADLPTNYAGKRQAMGFNVMYLDGRVAWRETPYCSAHPNDNIYAAEPGWGPDTDAYIRTAR